MLGGGGGFGGSSGGSRSRSSQFRGSGPGPARPAPEPEVTIVEKPLPLSLEDLFKGTHKKMKFQQKTFDANGKRTTKDRILEMDIKPGLKKGSKIKFQGVGDVDEGGRQDLHFIVEEVSYPYPYTQIWVWQGVEANTQTETTPHLPPRQRRHHPDHRARPQGSLNRLEAHRHDHRRQELQYREGGPDAAGVSGDVPGLRDAEEGRGTGEFRRRG
jgi:hypothetical protein